MQRQNLETFLESYRTQHPSEFYDWIKNKLDVGRLLKYFGRGLTILELVVLFQKKANHWGLDINRDRIYSALTYRLDQLQIDNEVDVQKIDSVDETLYFLIKKVMARNQIPYLEGELRVILPTILRENYSSIFRDYYHLRFVTERDCIPAFSKAETELNGHIRNASDRLKDAVLDPEVICFLASFYKDCLEHSNTKAKSAYSQKAADLKIVDRLQYKYGLTDDDTTALRYTVYKAVKALSAKI